MFNQKSGYNKSKVLLKYRMANIGLRKTKGFQIYKCSTFAIKSLSSTDFKLVIVAVKSRSSLSISSSNPLDWMAPAAAKKGFSKIMEI